ncbi:DNA methyltransferase [Mycobacteroides abscessus]|uniref:DNA methyltransferase n=1 Tax=Mycobacteroides abscessus TaxID=36809 RepID=UPI0018965AB9
MAKALPDGAADCIVTSPPYFGLRDYGEAGQYGLEDSPADYVETMRVLFAELRRVLANDGTLWLNLGDTYTSQPGWGRGGSSQLLGRKHAPERDTVAHRRGLAPKNLLGIPWRVAFALQDDGWILRNDIIWAKPSAMPESVTDRLSGKHEYVFMFSKSRRYWFDLDAIREPHEEVSVARARPHRADPGRSAREGAPYAGITGAQTMRLDQMNHPRGRNPGDVWDIATQPFPGAHFATMPPKLAQRCIAAGCKPGGMVLDPFSGSGTTGMAAQQLGRKYVGIDLNSDYLELSLKTRLRNAALDFGEGA